MDAQGAGIREELSDALSQLSGLVDKLQQKAMETPAIDNSSGNQNRLEINLPDLDRAAKRSQTTMTVACVLLTAFALWIATDARADLRALRIEQANELRAQRAEQLIMYNWVAQEVTAIRSYITTGKLAPMSPRPIGSTQQEKR